uniref:Midasin n=1 Tax=Panagrolaimus sp. JU765 TaxID=591449 RepID=A0AC34QRE3_9BILA
MASELAENLRQIMEPSIANRLQGDYRTGKRLNMRRLVSYIASDYRKNRIWLRRTKKQQRNFQIMIAIDDSGSMGDNRMDEITCQSVCLIEKAFRQLEIGQLAICKFGQKVQMLREFTNATDAQDTLIASLLANLNYTTFENGVPKLTPYISVFPFPFYALVRTVSTLPGTLAEAIRQWVEMAMND